MKISLNWLHDFISLKEKNFHKIKEVITARTAEIETMERQGEHLEGIVVGKVVELMPHPNADALRLAKVDNGNEVIKVVCGGSNLKEHMKVAFAQIGSVVRWHGTEVVKLEKAKIRGEESFGMICGADEIGLLEMFPKKSEKEIVDLSHIDVAVGTPLAEALGLNDVVLDIDNHAITHRADLFSHRGFAREFVANGLGVMKKAKAFKMPKTNSPAPIDVTIKNKDVCSRYMGVYITGIEIADSPDWMKQRLSACGIRPMANIIDITNYVMLELGMPLHAFDLDQVKGKKWTMRKSKKGEKVVTLDEKEHELPEDVIILDDGHEIFDLCGIMGGYTSGIGQHTKHIWLHSPVYHSTLVRRAMRALAQISDASIIYEKGVDDEVAEDGLIRATELILQLCPNAVVASKVMDIRNVKPETRKLDLKHAQIERLVGKVIKPKEVETTLKNLGFALAKKAGGYSVTVPSWRLGDVTMEADLIEEIARIHGYDNIPPKTPVTEIAPTPIIAHREMDKAIKNRLTALGFDEINTFAFLGPELLAKCGMMKEEQTIEVANAISNDLSLMRQSLLPWTLETVAQNLRYAQQFRLFELSKVYAKTDGQSHSERSNLIVVTVGEDFRILEGVMEHLGLKPAVPSSSAKPEWRHPGRVADLTAKGKVVGTLYEVHPQILKNFDIKAPVVVAEVDMDTVYTMDIDRRLRYFELPRFPSVQLDVSILIPKKRLAEEYMKAIKKADQTLITKIDLIDEYTGDKIAANERSLTFSITYQAPDRTLKEEEANAVHTTVIKTLEMTGAKIRA